jgi:hypothetical protein
VPHKHWNRLRKQREVQWDEQNDVAVVGPSIWLEHVKELRRRGLLEHDDERSDDDDLG